MYRPATIVMWSLAAVGISLLLAGCDGDGGGGDGDEGSDSNPHATAAEKCVDAINAYRQTESLPAYERWVDQERCTNDAAESDSKSGKAHGAFGACEEAAQNECPGWPGPPAEMIGSMASFPLPDPRKAVEWTWPYFEPLQDALFFKHQIEVPIFPWPEPPKRLLRVSAQIYNEMGDYEKLGDALKKAL